MSEKLKQLREQIDRLDDELLILANRRAALAQQVGHLKEDGVVLRPEREAQVLARMILQNPGPLSPEGVKTLFTEIISQCRALEAPLTIAYLGPEGTFTEAAALKRFGSAIQEQSCATIDEVFRDVVSGAAHYGVVPVENSSEGAVGRTLDLLMQSTLKICGEVKLPIHQCLLGQCLPGQHGELSAINSVYSHPQSFGQCQGWLNTHLPHAARIPVASNAEAIAGVDIVLLGIKPQVLHSVMPELAGKLTSSQLVISILAGATTRALGDGLKHPAIVRAMPNTPAQIGQGVTVWYATDAVSDTALEQAQTMLRALGREFQVHDERQVAMATALSGTGPTYIFLFLEALIDAGVHLGFPRHVARELVLDTLVGSGNFALQSGKHVAALRDMVTSPGGTSAEALYELENGRLRTVISDAVWAAFGRTLELEARLEGSELSRPTRRLR